MPFDKKTILVVEDDQAIRSTLLELLTVEGYSVLLAEHGMKALEVLKGCEQLPSLIILDLSMPVMDGRTFLAEYRKQFPNLAPHIPVLIITAAGELAITDICEVEQVLHKPLDVDNLMERIEKSLEP